MLGKRKAIMRKSPSARLIGSGSVNGDSSPLPEHPKEKLKSSNHQSPGACGSAPPQVIGFLVDKEADHSSSPIPTHRARSSSKSPGGSPRSGLGDLLSGSRPPWERKDEGVGLGIVAALSGSQEDVCKEREDARGYSVPGAAAGGGYGARKTSPPHLPSVFAPSRASPPIPIHPSALRSNSGHHSPSHCTDPGCCPGVAFELAPSSFKQESIYLESSSSNTHQVGEGSRPNHNWSRSNPHNGVPGNWSQQADMDVDRNEFHVISTPAHLVHSPRHNLTSSPSFSQNFLDACHLCRRRLGEGRDIYIYRGDKAFCSPECRHQQILNDERIEKCAAAVMKVGAASDVRNTAQRSRVMAAGTATAAAA